MGSVHPLLYRATPEEYHQQAEALFDALKSGDEAAEWRFKWEHPRFRGKSVTEVRAATLSVADAQLVVAHDYGFDNWEDLSDFTDAVRRDGPVDRFETAVEAVISGNLAALRSMLRENPELVRARSTRRHHATLLHYVGANGVEGVRQKTPENAVEVAKMLLETPARSGPRRSPHPRTPASSRRMRFPGSCSRWLEINTDPPAALG